MQSKKHLRALTEGAIMVALAWVLSFLKIDLWFQGGSVDIVMVPLVIYAVRWGLGWGLGAGLIMGTIKYFFAMGWALSWVSIIFDYSVAYMMIGFAGLFKGKKQGFAKGAVIGGLMRFIMHYISGVTVYASYMPEAFMGMTMTSPYVYSALYNGGYMLPNIIMAVILGILLEKPLSRFMPTEKANT